MVGIHSQQNPLSLSFILTVATDTFIVTQCVATEQCCYAHGTSRLYASGLVVTRFIHLVPSALGE